MYRVLVIGLAMLLAACQSIVVHEARSAYSHIRIVDRGTVRTMLFVWDNGNTTVETEMDLQVPYQLQHPYSHTMMAGLLYAREPASCLVVGLGGGAFVRFLNHEFPEMQVDVVEIDPVIVDIAREYFGTMPGPRTRIFVADAVQHFRSSSERYDLIFVDAHLKPGEETDAIGVPSRLKTIAFLKRIGDHLKPGGVVVFNLVAGTDASEGIANLRDAFQSVEVFLSKWPGNSIVVGIPAGPMPRDEDIRALARKLDQNGTRNFLFQSLLGERVR